MAARDPLAPRHELARAARRRRRGCASGRATGRREHVRFTTQPLEHTDGQDDLLAQMLEAAGAPDILCFASDYPHWDFDEPGQLLRRLPESWRAAVMHDNAAAFYGARLGAVPA